MVGQIGSMVVCFGAVFASIVFVGIVGALGVRQRAAAMEAWQRFGQETGMPISGNYPMIQFHGSFQGGMVSLMHFTWRGHKGQRHYRYDLGARIPMNCGDLMVDREGFFDMIGKAFGGQDIQVGDPAFDPAFRIRGSNPEQVIAVLGPSARQALLRAVQSYPTIHIANGMVRISRNGIASADQVRGELQAVVSIANAFQPTQQSAWAQPAQWNPYG